MEILRARWLAYAGYALFWLAEPSLGQQTLVLGPLQSPFSVGIQAEIGKRVALVCAASDGSGASVYGTDVYTSDSAVCAAAIHAGELKPGQAGVVRIEFGAGAEAFVASTRNGVTTRAYGRWGSSYTFVRDDTSTTITWRTTWNWNGPRLDIPDPVAVTCPPGGRTDMPIYGTDVYAASSAICVAAVHAGAITADVGGDVVVRSVPGPREYLASERNGIASRRWSGTADAFGVATASPAGREALVALVPQNGGSLSSGISSSAHGNAATGANSLASASQGAPAASLLPDGAVASQGTPSAALLGDGAASSTGIDRSPGAGESDDAALRANAPASAGFTAAEPVECVQPGPAVTVRAASPAGVRLGWTPVAGATGYIVERDDLGLLTQDPVTATEFEHGVPLDYRESHGYTVTAIQSQGCAATTIAVAPQKPAAPYVTSVRATTGNLVTRKGSVTLAFGLRGSDATGFVVHGPGAGGGIELAANATGAYELRIDNLDPGQHAWLVVPVWETPAGRWFDVTTTATTASANVGFYRVIVAAVQAVNETADDPTNIDGVGDEVYAAAALYVDGRFQGIARTRVHGDTIPPNAAEEAAFATIFRIVPSHAGRVQAGTGTSAGGIRTGDLVPAGLSPNFVRAAFADQFPLIAWEGWIGGDAVVEIVPSLWEFDGDSTAFDAWSRCMNRTREGEQRGQIGDEILEHYQEQETEVARGALEIQGAGLPIGTQQAETEQEQRDERDLIREQRIRVEEMREDDCAAATADTNAAPAWLKFGVDDYIGDLAQTVRYTVATAGLRTLTLAEQHGHATYTMWLTMMPVP